MRWRAAASPSISRPTSAPSATAAGFRPAHIHVIASETVRGARPDLARAHRCEARASARCRRCRLLGRIRPAAVVGFGGYPTVPPVLAAALRGIPTLIHEQNAVMGRANRLLAAARARDRHELRRRARPRAEARRQGDPHRQSGAAGGDRRGRGALRGARRDAARCASSCSAAARARASCRISCRPPSSGSSRICDARLAIVQQAREEDIARVTRDLCAGQGHAPRSRRSSPTCRRGSRPAIWSSSRSGASTVAELAAIGRPAILVPLPHALDQDQAANAGVLERAGGAIRLPPGASSRPSGWRPRSTRLPARRKSS